MKVKDIKEFRRWLKLETDNPNKDENFIGFSYPYGTDSLKDTKSRGFFNVYHNQAKDIDARLSTVLDMAQDSQAIYEFVQNAVDCDSTAFFMFYENDHFIAINNGKPFNQDGIRAILNFAQSTKTRDENIGKFGVGFKLIHRMVGAGNGLHELTKDYVGPIVFSWSKTEQLSQLLEITDISEIAPDDDNNWDNSDAAWFFKILLTCVPILPHQFDNPLRDIEFKERTDLFSEQEFFNFQGFLKKIWAEHQDKFTAETLAEGSMFYLKLGEEKGQKLDEDFSYFKKGIQYSLSFVANLMNKKGLKRIYFKDEEPIEKDNIDINLEPAFVIDSKSEEFAEIKAKLKENDKDRNISFVFGYQDFVNNAKYGELRSSPNFYKFFPMGKEVCGLNFIVHSNIFEIEASRREFVQDDDRNKFVLTKLAKGLEKRLVNYQITDPSKYSKIFLAILFSKDPVDRGKDSAWISKTLYQPLLAFITNNCPALEGDYKSSGQLVMKDTDLDLSLASFGIVDKFWFKWSRNDFKDLIGLDGKKDLTYEKLIKTTWTIIDLVREGNAIMITDWLSKAVKRDLVLFEDELTRRWGTLSDAKLWSKVVAITPLIDLVVDSEDQKVKYNFVKNIAEVNLSSTHPYVKNDHESKILALAFEALKTDADIEEFRNKVLITDEVGAKHKLFEVREDDRINFKNPAPNSTHFWQMNLSEVLPLYKNKSGLLHQIIKNFDRIDIKLQTFFGVRRQKPHDEIYRMLLGQYQQLTEPSQFIFLVFYSLDKNADHIKNFDLTQLVIGDILSIYIENDYPFPAKYAFYLNAFDPLLTVFPDEWAISTEKMPVPIKNWLADDNDGLKEEFLNENGVNFKDSTIVKIRKSIDGPNEITKNHFELACEKNPKLLLNTMSWLMDQHKVITGQKGIEAIVKLFEVYYNKVDYTFTDPQLYIKKLTTGDQPEYEFLSREEDAYQLHADDVTAIYGYGVSLSDIFNVLKSRSLNLLDLRLYPSGEFSRIKQNSLIISNEPDYDYLHHNSFSFDLAFFVDWQAQTGNKVLFFNGQIPWGVSFENVKLRTYASGNYCKDPVRRVIYINLNPLLDNIEKADLIVAMITGLPSDYLLYETIKSLDFAYWRWKLGEDPDITELRKQQLKDAETYSFPWLKALFDWEYDATSANTRSLKLSFEKVTKLDNKLVLASCNYETIPTKVEFHPDPVELKIKRKNDVRTIACTIVNFSEFELVVLPISKPDKEYLAHFTKFDGFKASFRLPGEDVLMSRLRDGLFGGTGVAPKDGSLTDYLIAHIPEQNLSFLFGPPGTGKTTKVAVDILMTLFINHQFDIPTRILVLTPTNKAADVVVERAVQLLSDPDKLKEAAITYYDSESVRGLMMYSQQLYSSGSYKHIFIRYGNSVSETLLSNELVHNKFSEYKVAKDLVLATTVHRLPFDQFNAMALKAVDQGWTHIVIDEASMVSLPHSVFTLLQLMKLPPVKNTIGLTTTFTISGDPFQIQPVGQTPNYLEQGIEKMKGWSTENIYTIFELKNFSMNHTPVGNYKVRKLMTQYRSVPALGSLFSKYKYDNSIRHKKRSNVIDISLGDKKLNNINFIRFPVFDEKGSPQQDVYTIQKYGEFSAYHIYTVVLACELASAIKLQNPEKTVSIITPYGTQARLIKEISYSFINQNKDNVFDVSTVHRYQGDENDVVIFVMTPPKTNPFEYSHFNNAYLINVGISRAKECLFILHPENITTYSEIDEIVIPLAEHFDDYYCDDIERVIFPKSKDDLTSALTEMIDVTEFQSFNIADLKEFSASGKQYLFFADTRELSKDEKRYANVIVNIKQRRAITTYLSPKEGMIIHGIVENIHMNNKTAFIKLDRIKDRGVIHNNAVSNEFISDINQVLKVNQKIKARIHSINAKGITLSMKGIKQA